MKKFCILALSLSALFLSSCHDAPKPYVPPPISFAAGAPIRVNVAQIKVVEDYQAPLRAPNVEQDFPTPPAVAVKQWANTRLLAAGHQGVLEVAIEDASVRETKLPLTTGLKGMFTDEQSERYDASIKVTMRLYSGAHDLADAQGDVVVTRSQSIDEKATVDERTRLYQGMAQAMMTDFDTQANARLRQYFAAFLM